EPFGGLERYWHARPRTDDGDVATFDAHGGLVQWNFILLVGHLRAQRAKTRRVEIDYWVGAAQRGYHQPLGIIGRRGDHRAHPRDVGIEAVNLVIGVLPGHARGLTGDLDDEHHRHRGLAAGHVAQLARMVLDDL